jgi:hypothetical protein
VTRSGHKQPEQHIALAAAEFGVITRHGEELPDVSDGAFLHRERLPTGTAEIAIVRDEPDLVYLPLAFACSSIGMIEM